MTAVESPWSSWEERYQFGWDALEARIEQAECLMEDWDD